MRSFRAKLGMTGFLYENAARNLGKGPFLEPAFNYRYASCAKISLKIH